MPLHPFSVLASKSLPNFAPTLLLSVVGATALLSILAGGSQVAREFTMHRSRRSGGFTLVELLVVVVVIGILAAIALPNFIGAQKKAKAASVRGNMHTTQIASEAYATDSGAIYAPAAVLLQPYYPGGSSQAGGTAGAYPTNPVTGVANEAPVAAGPTTSANIATLRASAPSFNGVPGRHAYNRVDAGASYAVVGFDANGYTVSGNSGKVLVLSNQ